MSGRGVWLALLLWAGSALGQGESLTFDSANKLYEEGKYAEAARTYEELLQSGKASEALYFNLGNACFKAGQIGRAIAAYRLAERLNPRDPDLRANLQFARRQIQGPTLPPAVWQSWLERLTLNEWTFVACITLWLLFLLLILGQWRPPWRRALRSYVLASGFSTLALLICLALVLHARHFVRRAVVIDREAVARQGPLDESQTAFVLHDGAELEVLDQKDNWLQVSTDPRRIGWVRRDQVLIPSDWFPAHGSQLTPRRSAFSQKLRASLAPPLPFTTPG